MGKKKGISLERVLLEKDVRVFIEYKKLVGWTRFFFSPGLVVLVFTLLVFSFCFLVKAYQPDAAKIEATTDAPQVGSSNTSVVYVDINSIEKQGVNDARYRSHESIEGRDKQKSCYFERSVPSNK